MGETADAIDALLPQHQCQRCGYAGCRPYAEAIANGEAEINRCPPGGEPVLQDLAQLTGHPSLPLAADVEPRQPAQIARIDAERCIGCTKCLPACPVDAIAGSGKLLHEVIDAACTGCGLCIPPCPVDCITLEPIESESEAQRHLAPSPGETEDVNRRLRLRGDELRMRYARHQTRLADTQRKRQRRLDSADADDVARRKREIADAVARVKARRGQRG